MMNLYYKILVSIILSVVAVSCTTRQSKPVITENNTITYQSLQHDKVNAEITFGRTFLMDTRQALFSGQTFPVADDEEVHCIVDISNYESVAGIPQLFHVDWIGSDGKTIYIKDFTKVITDTSSALHSSISTGNRDMGLYGVRVYYFRELIAEKYFRLIPGKEYSDSLIQKVGAEVVFCKRYNEKKDKLIKQDTAFYKGKNRWVTVVAQFENQPDLEGDEIKYRMEWITPSGEITYNKILTYTRDETPYVVRSSIPFGADDRPPGKYKINLYWYDQFLVSGSFTLLPEKKKPKLKHLNIGSIPIKLSAGKSRKNSTELEGKRIVSPGKGIKVYANIDLSNVQVDRRKSVKVQWVGSNGKSFYSKEISLIKIENLSNVSSAISVTPGKRTPGNYKLRILYTGKIIAEEKFRIGK